MTFEKKLMQTIWNKERGYWDIFIIPEDEKATLVIHLKKMDTIKDSIEDLKNSIRFNPTHIKFSIREKENYSFLEQGGIKTLQLEGGYKAQKFAGSFSFIFNILTAIASYLKYQYQNDNKDNNKDEISTSNIFILVLSILSAISTVTFYYFSFILVDNEKKERQFYEKYLQKTLQKLISIENEINRKEIIVSRLVDWILQQDRNSMEVYNDIKYDLISILDKKKDMSLYEKLVKILDKLEVGDEFILDRIILENLEGEISGEYDGNRQLNQSESILITQTNRETIVELIDFQTRFNTNLIEVLSNPTLLFLTEFLSSLFGSLTIIKNWPRPISNSIYRNLIEINQNDRSGYNLIRIFNYLSNLDDDKISHLENYIKSLLNSENIFTVPNNDNNYQLEEFVCNIIKDFCNIRKLKEIVRRENEKLQGSQIEGFNYQAIPGDGHCLYNAVGLYLGETQDFLRSIVAAHLEHNLESFRQFIALLTGKKIEEYLHDVRNGIEWASHVEIEALMRTLDRPILVIESDGRITNPDNAQYFSGEPIFVYYNGHNHYDALLIKEGFDGRSILQMLLTKENKQLVI